MSSVALNGQNRTLPHMQKTYLPTRTNQMNGNAGGIGQNNSSQSAYGGQQGQHGSYGMQSHMNGHGGQPNGTSGAGGVDGMWGGNGMGNGMDVDMQGPEDDKYDQFDPELLEEEDFGGSDIDAEGEMDMDMPGFTPGSTPPTSANASKYPSLQSSVPAVPQSAQRPNTSTSASSGPSNVPYSSNNNPSTSGWKGYPETQGVMVDPRSIIQSRMNGNSGGNMNGQVNAVASSSRVAMVPGPSMTIAPSQLQSARPKASVSKSSAASSTEQSRLAKMSTPVAAKVLAKAFQASQAAAEIAATTAAATKASKAAAAKAPAKAVKRAAPNPHLTEVRALFHRDRLADTTRSPLPRLVEVLGQRKSDSESNKILPPRLMMGAKDVLEMMDNMKMAPRRFQKDFVGNELAVEMSTSLLDQCVSGMKQDGDDELIWARACLAAIAVFKAVGQSLTLGPIRKIVAALKEFSPKDLPASVTEDLKDKLKTQRQDLRATLKTRAEDLLRPDAGGTAGAEKASSEATAKKRKADDATKVEASKKARKEASPPSAARASAAAGPSRATAPIPRRTGADMSGGFGLSIPAPSRSVAKPQAKAQPDHLADLFHKAKQNAPQTEPIKIEQDEDYQSESGLAIDVKVTRTRHGGRPPKRVRWRPDSDLVAIREIEGRDQSITEHGHAQNLEHEGWAMKQLQEDGQWYSPEFMPYVGGGQEDPSPELDRESTERENRTAEVTYPEGTPVPTTPGGDPDVAVSTVGPSTVLYLDLRRIIKENPNGLSTEDMDHAFESRYEPRNGLIVPSSGPGGWIAQSVVPDKPIIPDNAQLAGLLSLIGPRPTAAPAPPAPAIVAPLAAPVFDFGLLQSLGTTLGVPVQQPPQPSLSGGGPSYPMYQNQGYQQGTYPAPQQHEMWRTDQQGAQANNGGWSRSNTALPTPPVFAGSGQGQRRGKGGGGGSDGDMKGICRFEKTQGYCVKDNCQWVHQNPKQGQR